MTSDWDSLVARLDGLTGLSGAKYQFHKGNYEACIDLLNYDKGPKAAQSQTLAQDIRLWLEKKAEPKHGIELSKIRWYGMELVDKGGPGSGNFGHAGRPGERGGSAEGGGGSGSGKKPGSGPPLGMMDISEEYESQVAGRLRNANGYINPMQASKALEVMDVAHGDLQALVNDHDSGGEEFRELHDELEDAQRELGEASQWINDEGISEKAIPHLRNAHRHLTQVGRVSRRWTIDLGGDEDET